MSYIKHNIEQGTPEWIKMRLGYVTASDVPCLFDVGYRTELQTYNLKVQQLEPPSEGSKEALFSLGHMAEKEGRKYVEAKYNMSFPPMVITNPIFPEMMASLDGLNEENGVLFEAKYTGAEKFEEIVKGNLPRGHYIQVQAQMMVAGFDKLIYYARDTTGNKHIIPVTPDRQLQSEIYRKVRSFTENMKHGTPPPPGPRDILDVTDHRFEIMGSIADEIKTLETQFDEMKKEIAEAYPDYSKIKCGGFSLIKSVRKGNIAYAKIPELKKVDLESYRGKTSTSYTFRSEKKK